MTYALIAYLPPALLLAAAAAAFARPGRRPALIPMLAEGAAIAALAMAAAVMALLVAGGGASAQLPGALGQHIGVRVDPVSATMLLLVAFIGWVVVRYSRRYLDGEERQGAFTGWLMATLAAVALLVTAGTLAQLVLAWFAVGACIHRLLLFYPDRAGARRAARKKAVSARIGDVSILAAAILLGTGYGTGEIGAILDAARAGSAPAEAGWAAGLIVVAALMKSAQFPLHGWLTEVMEAPTPVSALLHAGIVNAGGFLVIRFADVMLLWPGALAVLALAGGFTALYASVVMLTQPAVKSSLAWSTIAQMGFMLLQCGLALFPLALLHIVAHSLYKAHAFLGAGREIARVAALRRPGPVAVPGIAAVGRAFALAVAIYVVFGFLFGFAGKAPQIVAMGAILVMGTAYLLAQGLADAAPAALTRWMAIYSAAAAVAYFGLQTLASWATAGTLPPPPEADGLEWAVIVLSVLSFGFVALAQAMLPLWSHHPAAAALRVHIANGFYANAIADRLLGSWSRTTAN